METDGSPPSVGEYMQDGSVFGHGHTLYEQYTMVLEQEVRRLAAQRAAEGVSKHVVMTAVAMSAADEERMRTLYANYRLVSTGARAALHPAYEVERTLATEWARLYCKTMSPTVVLVGDALLNIVMHADEDTHLEVSGVDAYAMQVDYQSGYDLSRMLLGGEAFKKATGYAFPEAAAKRFLSGAAYTPCHKADSCTHKAGAYMVDVSMHPISVHQFARGMLGVGASVGVALVPYTPDMLVSPEGVLPGTDVGYAVGPATVEFMFANGTAGAPAIAAGTWHEWLGVSQLELGGAHFSLERVERRGNFLFCVMTRVATPVVNSVVRHALDLPGMEKRVQVMTHKLKSLGADPNLPGSWEKVYITADERLVKNVYMHALTLRREDFSEDCVSVVMNRLFVGDNRVTLGGGYVSVDKPLTTREAHDLVSVITARVFIDRYKAGALSSELLAELSRCTAFVSASTAGKCGFICRYYISRFYNHTIGALVAWVRRAAVAAAAWLSRAPTLPIGHFETPASIVYFEDYAKPVRNGLLAFLQESKSSDTSIPGVRGAVRSGGKISAGYTVPVPAPVALQVSESDGAIVAETTVDLHEGMPGGSMVARKFVTAVEEVDQLCDTLESRFEMEATLEPDAGPYDEPPVDVLADPDWVNTLNDVHESAFPGMAQQEFQQDVSSLHYDTQHRQMDPTYLAVPLVSESRPSDANVYKSNMRTWNVQKYQQTLPQLLSALQARNMSPPAIAEAQDEAARVEDVFDNFIDMACAPGTRERMAAWKLDPVGFEREALLEWASKAAPGVVERLEKRMREDPQGVELIPLHEYQIMVKSDAKPPMSAKPLVELVTPQVIAFQDKHASALYSSVFRVLARRFESCLKPGWLVAMRKNMTDIRDHIRQWMPWNDIDKLLFLENDFSKYDKSQGNFCTMLKRKFYAELGMSDELLERWMRAQSSSVYVNLAEGIKLHVADQQKSGDGATTLANTIVNVASVCYAYKGTIVDFAVFIGDDSLVGSRAVCATERSINLLAQLFNLQAKFILSKHPYFASHFIACERETNQIFVVPDPVKRMQRLGVSVTAVDPKWEDKYRSFSEDCDIYLRSRAWAGLDDAVVFRYPTMPAGVSTAMFTALASCVRSFENFRKAWADKPEVIHY